MTLSDKELEDRIEELGNKLATPPSDVQQLLLLLDKAESFLSKVDQCPSDTMHTALRPSMKALVAGNLLRHSDLDVKIAIASCLSEITRITAPEAPFDDDLMKEIFGLIVGAFKNLDEMPSRSFSKRVSILETVAKVRSCVLMLDLECDDLILEMFHHFLKTIRPTHSDTVFTSMETVMSLVIEESENISTKLLLCLLDYLKTDENNTMSSAKDIAEKVFTNCALKLKPYLVELLKENCTSSNDYSNIVAVICQGNHGSSNLIEMNISGETQADDSKLPDSNPHDELHQETSKQDIKVALPEKNSDADGSSKSVMSNGTFQIGNGDSIASDHKAEFTQSGNQSGNAGGSRLVDSASLHSNAPNLDSGLNVSSRRSRKRKGRGKLLFNNDNKIIDDETEQPANTGRRKGRGKEAELSNADNLSFKEVEIIACPKSGKKNKPEPLSGLADASTSVSLHISNKLDEIHPRKARRSDPKQSRKIVTIDKGEIDDSSKKGIFESGQTSTEKLPLKELSLKKSEIISEPERNLLKCSEKLNTNTEDSKSTPIVTMHDSSTKQRRHRGRSGPQRESNVVELSDLMRSPGSRQHKGRGYHGDEEDKEVKLKELVSPRKLNLKEMIKGQSNLNDVNETKSRRKRAQATSEVFTTPKHNRTNNKIQVGMKIRVWWPDDIKFYDGVIDSFDRSTKKHTILYNDGDVEVLLLENEIWEFIEAENVTGGVQESNSHDNNISEVKNKKPKGRRGHTLLDKIKTDIPLKSSPDSSIRIDSNDKLPKRKGRPPNKIVNDETGKKSIIRRGKSADKDRKDKNPSDKGHKENHQNDSSQLKEFLNKLDNEKVEHIVKPEAMKSMDKVDNEASKSGDKVGIDTFKIRIKSKGNSKSSMKSKNSSPKSRKRPSDALNTVIMYEAEDSPKTKSTEHRRKPGRRSAKRSSLKEKVGISTPIKRNMDANDLPMHQPELGETEASAKKRKRAKLDK